MLCAIEHDNSKKGTEQKTVWLQVLAPRYSMLPPVQSSSLQKLKEFIYRQVVPSE